MLRLGEIQPGHWLVYNYSLVQLSLSTKCPECGKRNMCDEHGYGYIIWFYGFQKGVDLVDEDVVTVFQSKSEAQRYMDSRSEWRTY